MHSNSPSGYRNDTSRDGNEIAQSPRRMARSTQPAGAEAAEYDRDVPTLLLIEPGGAVRELLDAAPGMLQVKHVASLAEGLALLVTEPPRAVLLDLSMPQARD